MPPSSPGILLSLRAAFRPLSCLSPCQPSDESSGTRKQHISHCFVHRN